MSVIPVGIYLVKVNNGNTRTRCGICLKFIFIVNFEHISHLVLVFLSSNVNGVIRAVLNFFYKNISHTHTHTHTKHTKHTKHKNEHKRTKMKKTAFYAFKNN